MPSTSFTFVSVLLSRVKDLRVFENIHGKYHCCRSRYIFFFKFFLPLNDNCYLLRFSVRDREWRIKTIVLWLQVEVVWCFGADDNSQVMIF